MRRLGLITLLVFVPVAAHAAVLINEVAWMGTAANANAEWMELLNPGDSAVDLSGWRLVAGNGSPNIALTGSIAAHGYFLLERTNDSTVPGVTADQIYTGALTNSGTTLALTDAGGATADQVDGGTNWAGIGGDNATKETAQRTSSGWETAAGTPRAANAGVAAGASADTASDPDTGNPPANTADATTTPATASGGPAEYLPIPVLKILTSGDRTVSSGADTAFTAAVYDSRGNKRDDAIVTWSFGDGMQRTGASVFHTYYEAGDYAVVVHAKTADDGDALMESTVTVKDAAVRIASISAHGITLANPSARTLDLSLWRLSMGGQTFIIPADTEILAGRSVLFPAQVIELPLASSAALLYPGGEVAAIYPMSTAQPASQPSSGAASYINRQAVEPITSQTGNVPRHDNAVGAPAAATSLAAAGAALPQPDEAPPTKGKGILQSPWTLGFLGVVLASGGAFIFL
jgi:hypothetical protein